MLSKEQLCIRIVSVVALAGLLACSPDSSPAQARYPSEAMTKGSAKPFLWADVRDYGAKGDGKTDDTKAILKAAALNKAGTPGSHPNGGVLVYLPAGTYLVSDTVIHNCGIMRRFFYGDGMDKTVIRLADNAPGFGNPGKPKPVLATHPIGTSQNGNSFRNSVYDLTVDTGAGNPGALGIYYKNCNQGCIVNVHVRSGDPKGAGYAGIDASHKWPGPGLFRNVKITGFDYGIRSSCNQYSLTFKNITLEGQRKAGILNDGHMLFIHKLTSRSAAPAIQSSGRTVLVDGQLAGKGPAAIQSGGNRAMLYARDVKTSGYAAAIKHDRQIVRGPAVAEYVSGKVYSPFGKGAGSLHLPIEESPEIPWDPPSEWANVKDFGKAGGQGTDASEAIQKAIDSGATTVFFPRDRYAVNKTVIVRGKVRRIIGMQSVLEAPDSFAVTDEENPSVFKVVGDGEPVIIERLEGGMGKGKRWFLEHAADRDVVLAHSGGRASGIRLTGKGNLFLEDHCGPPLVLNGQKVWAWQHNPEGHGVTRIVNRGGRYWCVGLKTEGPGIIAQTTDDGATEILGAYIYPYNGTGGAPAFVNDNSQMSVAIWINSGATYKEHVKETRNGVTRALTPAHLGGKGRYGTLYTSK